MKACSNKSEEEHCARKTAKENQDTSSDGLCLKDRTGNEKDQDTRKKKKFPREKRFGRKYLNLYLRASGNSDGNDSKATPGDGKDRQEAAEDMTSAANQK